MPPILSKLQWTLCGSFWPGKQPGKQQGIEMTTKKTKKDDSAKQKPKKAPATVQSAKADIEALGARVSEEIQGLTQRHEDLQATTAQDMEQLRTGLGKLERFAGDVDARLEAMEKQVGSLREAVLQEVSTAIQDAVQTAVRDAMDQAAKDMGQVRDGLEKMEGRIQGCAARDDIAACRSSAEQDISQVRKELEAVRQSVENCVSREELSAHQGRMSEDVGMLRTGLEKLNHGIEEYAKQFQLTDQRLQDVAQHATAQQERVVALLNALEAEPWNSLHAELEAKLQHGLTALENSLNRIQQDAGQVNTNLQEAVDNLRKMETQAGEKYRTRLDEMAQALAGMSQRLDELEKRPGMPAVPSVAQDTSQPQSAADSPAPVPAPVSVFGPASDSGPLPAAGSEDVAGSTPTSAQEGLHKALLLWNGSCFTQPAAAVRLLSIALQYDPRNPELYNQRGLAHADAGEKDKAMADYGQALELDPSLPAVYHNRGLLAMKMNNKAQACDDFRSAAALGDDRAWNKARETGYCGGSLFKKLFRGVID
jgi:tetratricopeptide (TPR) repeat protein